MPQNLNSDRQYGILIYDIPTNNMKLYMRVYTKIRRKAIMLNKSVYLLLWGMRESLKGIIDEAVQETGQALTADFLPFDGAANEHVDEMAKNALERDIRDCLDRLSKKIQKCIEDPEEPVGPEHREKVQDQLRNLQALAIMFGFEGDIQGVLETARQTVDTIWARLPRRN